MLTLVALSRRVEVRISGSGASHLIELPDHIWVTPSCTCNICTLQIGNVQKNDSTAYLQTYVVVGAFYEAKRTKPISVRGVTVPTVTSQ